MIVHAIVAGWLALAAPAGSLPEGERPEFLRATIEAIATRNASALEGMFGTIEELQDERSSTVDALAVLDLLSGCELGHVRLLYGAVYTVQYECSKSRAEAKGCDSGDLLLIVSDTLAVGHRRKFSEECPLFVPR